MHTELKVCTYPKEQEYLKIELTYTNLLHEILTSGNTMLNEKPSHIPVKGI